MGDHVMMQMCSSELTYPIIFQERDRIRAEKSSAREAAAGARRDEIQQAAERARLDREHRVLEKEKEVQRAAALRREEQDQAARCLFPSREQRHLGWCCLVCIAPLDGSR